MSSGKLSDQGMQVRFFVRLFIILAAVIAAKKAAAEPQLSLGIWQSYYGTKSQPGVDSAFDSTLVPRFQFEESFGRRQPFRAEGDLNAVLPVQGQDEFYFWSQNLNVSYQNPGHRRAARQSRLTFGRATRDWSVLDQEWGVGLWQPLFRWDYLRPEQMGLT